MPFMAVFLASLFWTVASQMFAHLGRKMFILRLNLYKSCLGLLFFLLAGLATEKIFPRPSTLILLGSSGILGFALGDLFIFHSFSRMGPARTMMVASLGPGLIALASYLFLDQRLTSSQTLGLFGSFLGLLFLSQEKKSENRMTPTLGLLAFCGIILDSTGVILTKAAFMKEPGLGSFTANGVRIFAATVVLLLLSIWKKSPILPIDLSKKDLLLVLGSSFLGTFLSLFFYLFAISKENPSLIAAIGGMTPVYASLYEHWRDRTPPSWYFGLALFFMMGGLLLIVGALRF